jgi:hypothetical protein
MRIHSPNRQKGTSIAELPVNLWVFIFFMVLPLIDFCTLGYRATLAYSGVRDATTKAALQASFTLAKSTAGSVLGANAASWTGVGYGSTTVHVVQVDQAGAETEGGPDAIWAAPIVSNDVYLIRVKTQATCSPLLNLAATGAWNAVPGLTGPITLLFTYQVSAEHPEGLVK